LHRFLLDVRLYFFENCDFAVSLRAPLLRARPAGLAGAFAESSESL
jgi:hypothetical protein